MRFRGAGGLRNHIHCLIILPLVIILMTWPVFGQIFKGDEFWLHSTYYDKWQKIWDAWHLGQALAGESALYYTEAMFHPSGASLAFQAIAFPHALLLLALQQVIPLDSAFNLLYLLMLGANAFCAYLLLHRLLRDKWIALFGAVVVGVHPWFTDTATEPDLILIGTLPLTLYFFHRAVLEERRFFAALAGVCAGLTAFIGMYTFVFILMTAGIYCLWLGASRWRQPRFWLSLALFLGLSASISLVRLAPILADAAILEEGLAFHLRAADSNDLFDYLALTPNPITSGFLHSALGASEDRFFEDAYLGYLNLFLLACALSRRPLWRKLAPWLLTFLVFALLSLGDFLTVNGVDYEGVALPRRVLTAWFPALFGSIGAARYYLIGMLIPLAVLSCYGLMALLRGRPPRLRVACVLLATLFIAFEYYAPPQGAYLAQETTRHLAWLRAEDEAPVKVINLPQRIDFAIYYLHLQSLSDYPSAFGYVNRNRQSALGYVDSSYLLRHWYKDRALHCLPQSEAAYIASLEGLLADGFTHIVVHHWRWPDAPSLHSFGNAPAAYDDGYVSVYRLRDLNQSCQPQLDLPQLSRFARSPLALPGPRSSILSVHSRHRIDHENLGYLNSLFSDWHRFVHASAETGAAEIEDLTRESQIIALLVDEGDAEGADVDGLIPSERFQRCRRERHDDGAVIELHIRREFSCALISSDGGLRIEYENGARLENVIAEASDSQLDLQFFWSDVPDEAHSTSIQIVDAAGERALAVDQALDHASLIHQRVDIASFGPGDYQVNLIVYDFHSLRSVAGRISATGERFQRELTIMTLTRD